MLSLIHSFIIHLSTNSCIRYSVIVYFLRIHLSIKEVKKNKCKREQNYLQISYFILCFKTLSMFRSFSCIENNNTFFAYIYFFLFCHCEFHHFCCFKFFSQFIWHFSYLILGIAFGCTTNKYTVINKFPLQLLQSSSRVFSYKSKRVGKKKRWYYNGDWFVCYHLFAIFIVCSTCQYGSPRKVLVRRNVAWVSNDLIFSHNKDNSNNDCKNSDQVDDCGDNCYYYF